MKYDPNGNCIRHFIPVLKDMLKEYIYEPWIAPLSIQGKAKCVVGKEYLKPEFDHGTTSKECRNKMGETYAKRVCRHPPITRVAGAATDSAAFVQSPFT